MHTLKQKLLALVPEHEATLILFHVLRKTNSNIKNLSDLIVHAPTPTAEQAEVAVRIGKDRAKGFPLQHLLGTQFFLNHEYFVNSSTLIPRPETEILASAILEAAQKRFQNKQSFRFAELGLGTGILSIELLAAFSGAGGVASELNPGAITLAEKNLKAILGNSWSSRFQIVAASDPLEGFEALLSRGPYDLVISNPPYVSREDEIEEQVLDHEPAAALFPLNDDANFFYDNFLRYAPKLLTRDGVAFFEVPHERAEIILKSFVQNGFTGSQLISDLTGRSRVIEVKRPN